MTPAKIKSLILIIFFLLSSIAYCLSPASLFAGQVKEADLAGSWYPSDGRELSAMLEGFIEQADLPEIEGRLIALISPHAGFVFSGPVAAYGYKLLQGRKINTVIILGFSHRVRYDGIALYGKGEFETPLGNLEVDDELTNAIVSKSDMIKIFPPLFNQENSVETQLPFIKKVLPEAKIVPAAFGDPDYQNCLKMAEALAGILKEREDVIVIASTDLSHHMPYAVAKEKDRQTIALMEKYDHRAIFKKGVSVEQPCCGYAPVTTVLIMAEMMGADNFRVLKYANSGDTFGGKNRVVGYLSAAIYQSKVDSRKSIVKDEDKEMKMLNDKQRQRLLEIARRSVTSYVRDGKREEFTEDDPVLNKPMGAFVTLHKGGQLRGCIGNIIGKKPLYQTVADMAVESAVGDPRFPVVKPAELDAIDIEVSVLSEPEKVKDLSEIKIPGHGVVVKRGFRSGVYLPQVAEETGWSRDEFMSSLCASKAGLPPDAWKDKDTECYTFSAEVFGERR